MSTLTMNAQLTVTEVAKRTLDGNIMHIAETLSEINEIMKNAVMVECQDAAKFTLNRRILLPTGSFRKVNKGVATEGSVTQQIDEGVALLEGYSQIDEELALESGNPNEFRQTEDRAFMEGLMQTFTTNVFYGNIYATPERIQGFQPRYDDASALVKSASGTGTDMTSVYLVQWGKYRVHMIYPRGSMAGLSAEDLGLETIQDTDDYLYRGYRTHFAFKHGLAVHDDRCFGRVANIESTGGSNLFDPDLAIQILREMLEGATGVVAYANSTILAQLDIQAMDKANVLYTMKEVFGEMVTHFRGVPFRQVDKIVNTESTI